MPLIQLANHVLARMSPMLPPRPGTGIATVQEQVITLPRTSYLPTLPSAPTTQESSNAVLMPLNKPLKSLQILPPTLLTQQQQHYHAQLIQLTNHVPARMFPTMLLRPGTGIATAQEPATTSQRTLPSQTLQAVPTSPESSNAVSMLLNKPPKLLQTLPLIPLTPPQHYHALLTLPINHVLARMFPTTLPRHGIGTATAQEPATTLPRTSHSPTLHSALTSLESSNAVLTLPNKPPKLLQTLPPTLLTQQQQH